MIFLHHYCRRLVRNLYLQLIKPSIESFICLCADDVCLYLDLRSSSKANAEFLPCRSPCEGNRGRTGRFYLIFLKRNKTQKKPIVKTERITIQYSGFCFAINSKYTITEISEIPIRSINNLCVFIIHYVLLFYFKYYSFRICSLAT